MFAQKITSNLLDEVEVSPGSLMAAHLQGEAEMNKLRDGRTLAVAASSVLSQLPAGTLTLVATSPAGLALAAACAAMRSEPTRWLSLDLLLPATPVDGQLVVIDPIDGGQGWRDATLRRCPGARFVSPSPPRRLDLVA
jgi:hypothetical protein